MTVRMRDRFLLKEVVNLNVTYLVVEGLGDLHVFSRAPRRLLVVLYHPRLPANRFRPVTTKSFTPREFRPARWLPGPHLQTLGARFLRPSNGPRLYRERVELPDGDFVDLDFAFDPVRPGRFGEVPVVLLVHGLEGNARSKYALETYRALRAQGMAPIGLNFRSCSGELNRLARMYHSGDTADIQFILQLLSDRFPDRARGAIGFSLGGNALLQLLGSSDGAASFGLSAAAVISVPYDLSAGADHLVRPGSKLYAAYLIRKLQRKVRAKRQIMPAYIDMRRALAATTFREFDDAVTAPLHGFDGAEDYYRRSSSKQAISGIRIPTLLVHSMDDPFLPSRCVPVEAAKSNPFVTPVFTKAGGHVGFVARSWPWRPRFWAEQEVARFLGLALCDGAPVGADGAG